MSVPHYPTTRDTTVEQISLRAKSNDMTTTATAPIDRARNKQRQQRQGLHAYADFLDQRDWTAFCTFTTWHGFSRDRARNLMNNLKARLTSMQGGIEADIFFVSEPLEGFHNYHVHAFVRIETTGKAALDLIAAAWYSVCPAKGDKKKNRIEVEQYLPQTGAHYYVVKHIQKENVDYDFL